jgi:predicted DNA-binding protein
MKRTEKRVMYALRVPVSVLQRVRALSERYGATRSSVVVQILEAMTKNDAHAIAELRADVERMQNDVQNA